ncbi:Uncharacterised protein [Vibrio cholerae]|nr:Uncharacterised protein [Vibrio cholerae]
MSRNGKTTMMIRYSVKRSLSDMRFWLAVFVKVRVNTPNQSKVYHAGLLQFHMTLRCLEKLAVDSRSHLKS